MGAHQMMDWVEEWARASALTELVNAFGGYEPEDDLGGWLRHLETFSERWDFRGGKERNLVDATQLSPALTAQVLAGADALGLRGPNAPTRTSYKHVVILGGLVRACLARPRHAANLLGIASAPLSRNRLLRAASHLLSRLRRPRDASITADGVIALGGFRPLRGDEVELAARMISSRVSDEFEAMDAGARAAFSLGQHMAERREDSDEVGRSWAVREYVASTGLPVRVVAAPSSQPGVRRANTPDTYAWLAAESGWVTRGDSLLLVTTDIYRPFQHADALRMLTLPHGISIDVVGISPGAVDKRLAQPFQAHNYLQEIRSAIRSMRMLYDAAASVDTDLRA